MTWGSKWWPIFLIISSVWLITGFGIPETIALFQHPLHVDNTLSYYSRSELGVAVAIQSTVHTLAWWLSFIMWMLFVIFITAHIWFDQFG
ncbi:MAG TPA: hypothetical protein VGI71_23800 [Scandinavium sp.]|jgi:hypothetical protein